MERDRGRWGEIGSGGDLGSDKKRWGKM